MSKKKKKKQKVNKPQLSKLDKAIYYFIFLLLIGVCFGSIFLIQEIKTRVFFSDPNTLAWNARMTMMWLLFLGGFLTINTVGFIEETYGKRKAIFGNKKVDYSKHNYQFYPIFYKGYKPKRKMTEDKKREYKVNLTLWLIAFVFCCLLSSLGLFGREVLTKDGQVIKYSVFNNIKEQYYVSDISEVEFTTYSTRHKRRYDYSYAIKLHLKNSDDWYIFDNTSFDGTNGQSYYTTSIDNMKYLRDTVYKGKKITYNKEIPLKEITKNKRMTEEEIEKLYEFFNENKK